jgi:hypothetical protein
MARKLRSKETRKRLSRAEAIEILEDIARNTNNAAARIAAIKQLEAMTDGEQPTAEGFDALDNVAPIRRKAS